MAGVPGLADMIDLPLLIEEVQKRPALWDQSNPHRHNREVLEVLWEEVAKVFGAPREYYPSEHRVDLRQ